MTYGLFRRGIFAKPNKLFDLRTRDTILLNIIITYILHFRGAKVGAQRGKRYSHYMFAHAVCYVVLFYKCTSPYLMYILYVM